MELLQIPFLQNCLSFELIKEGYSSDEKWCIDNIYLLRISSDKNIAQLEQQAKLTNTAHEMDKRIPYVHDVGIHDGKAYMILDYIIGENGDIALPKTGSMDQYKIGQQVGKMFKNIHSIPAPEDHPNWEQHWTSRVQLLAPRFEKIASQHERYLTVLPFIESQMHLLKDRPCRVQHYDFHPGNILIHENQFTGLIDMQKITYADPVNEFYKMEYFNVPVSREYSCGVLDGYHDNQTIRDSFWKLHRLYAAIHIVSAEVWGHEGGIKQKGKFQKYTQFTLDQFEDFTVLVPKWYMNKTYG